jgi:hypothetical protein
MSRYFIWFPISDLGEPYIYHDSGVDYKKVGILLGQSSVTATSAYLGVSDNSALELARSISV